MIPKVIGLTGGIGSGKTTVASYFADLGVPVYIADDAAKVVMSSPDILKQITESFGGDIIRQNQINRPMLAQIVFNDAEKLKQLNAIVHPAVRRHFSEWLHLQSAPFIIKEAAILFESGTYLDCDSVITVSAPEDVRIARVRKRDNVSDEDVYQRIKNQWTDEQRNALSDFIIYNTTPEAARAQVLEIFTKINYSIAPN